jgi:pimeloyl-ACP methyl ester carboxylesterase
MDWSETPSELARAWTEQPVVMPGVHGDLYGVFTPPAPEASPAGLCVILFSRNRWWCDRLSIKGARWLASRGFPCLRFDYHGFGESEGVCQILSGDDPFTEDALTAIRYMRREFGQQRFVLSGFCLDGRTALSAITEEGDAIEAVVCSSPEITAYPGEVLGHIVTLEKARNFLRGSAAFKKITLRRAWRRCINLIKLAAEKRPGERLAERQVSTKFRRDFQALARSKARCLFLHGHDDPQYHAFRLVERTLLAKLKPEQRARITVEVWPGKIHLLENSAVLRKVADRTLSWIDGCRHTPFTLAQPVSWATAH